MNHSDFVSNYLTGPGVEIGAYIRPIPGIKPTYVDRYSTFAGEPTNADYFGDACDLPFHDSSLNYVASSHVLEHAANPLAALLEWFRVVHHGGYIYAVIPDRRKTFDRPRPLTEVSHMLEDYRNGVGMNDPTHIEDFAFGVEWHEFSPDCDPADEPKEREEFAADFHRKLEDHGEINIHFHTFESHTGVELIETGNREALWPGSFEIVEVVEDFPEPDQMGFLIVAKVRKNLGLRLKSILGPKGVRNDARKF